MNKQIGKKTNKEKVLSLSHNSILVNNITMHKLSQILLLGAITSLFFACEKKEHSTDTKAAEAGENTAGGFTLSGKLEGLTDGKAYLLAFNPVANGTIPIDTADVKGGEFSFSGKLAYPEQTFIAQDPAKPVAQLVLENAAVRIEGKAGDFASMKVTGSKSHDEFFQVANTVNGVQTQLNALMQSLNAEFQQNGGKLSDKSAVRLDSFLVAKRNIALNYLKTNPKSQIKSLVAAAFYIPNPNQEAPEYTVADKKEVLATLSEAEKNDKYGKMVMNFFKWLGEPAPDFTQNDPNDKPISLASYKGKYVLVDFWASWCKPCRAENPNVVKAYNQYKNKKFDILGVSLDESKEAWIAAIAQDKLTWKHVSDLKGWKNAASHLYGVESVPANFLIDPNGIIIGQNLRGKKLEKKLKSVL